MHISSDSGTLKANYDKMKPFFQHQLLFWKKIFDNFEYKHIVLHNFIIFTLVQVEFQILNSLSTRGENS